MTARELARRVLDRVDKGAAWATLTLDAELDRSGLDERDRRLASELVYGVLRNRLRIDRALAAHADLSRTPPKVRTALRVAAYQVLFLDRVPPYAAVDDAVAAARAVGGPKLAGFANA
ncbi:MAG TPA: transcription antitermination factor NusB, partial [Kofleriaceae bacterium]|nr:transcription antitermination factor NusB [Kofleriaceae bacterium]